MPIDHEVTLEDLSYRVPASARLMGLDLGTKSIGLAISDVFRRIASPLTTIKRTKFQADTDLLLGMCKKNMVYALVIGLPVHMQGCEGSRAQSTRSFVQNLALKTDLPVIYWDERLSTAAVTRMLLEAGVSRTRRAALVDKLAAAYLLQGALDRLSMLSSHP
ncbi:MAG: Holliday junction resolvase RuvX [Alphaproteobacteria bacterium]|nr:Holliday junction resolvase RuvX [Alphaproteobacteria bacterium]